VSRYKAGKWPANCLGNSKLINEYWRSVATQVRSEPEICQGVGFKLRVSAGIRAQRQLRIYLDSRGKSKNRDKQMHFIVRVMFRPLFILVLSNDSQN
jgi:hypothetical protein